jgi:catechol 2,3-dioxygenase-like lactoylglutathione lyase family enzyme
MLDIGEVCIYCKDLEGSLSFYKDILGLEEITLPGLTGDRVRLLRAGQTMLGLVRASPTAKPTKVDGHTGINHFAFFVNNIKGEVSALRKKGVKILTEPHEIVKGFWGVFFEGPDDVKVQLLEFTEGLPWK